ncbi:MAG: SH3 domain-containing protein [Spirochaetales bacterium]|nr:SH3 domain-containing protein [Spirochaetales bacterium]
MSIRRSLLIILILSVSMAAFPETLYISARVCPLLSKSKPAAEKVASLTHNTKVIVIEKTGKWIKVQVPSINAEGYVAALFTSARPTVMADIADYKTKEKPAAEAEVELPAGITPGVDVQGRKVISFGSENFDAVDWMEKFTYGDDELLEFAEEENIGI